MYFIDAFIGSSKVEQYLPDKASRSVGLRPTIENFAVMLFMPSKGEGIEVLANA